MIEIAIYSLDAPDLLRISKAIQDRKKGCTALDAHWWFAEREKAERVVYLWSNDPMDKGRFALISEFYAKFEVEVERVDTGSTEAVIEELFGSNDDGDSAVEAAAQAEAKAEAERVEAERLEAEAAAKLEAAKTAEAEAEAVLEEKRKARAERKAAREAKAKEDDGA